MKVEWWHPMRLSATMNKIEKERQRVSKDGLELVVMGSTSPMQSDEYRLFTTPFWKGRQVFLTSLDTGVETVVSRRELSWNGEYLWWDRVL